MNLTLSFNDITKTLTPIDHNGVVMFDLNEIHKGWDLPKTKLPSQWRGARRDSLERDANLHVMHQKAGCTLATQLAVFSYATWVSDEFFAAVIQCFTHVVNGDIEQAVRRSAEERAPTTWAGSAE